MKRLALGLSVVVAGCQSGTSQQADVSDIWKPSLKAYVTCNYINSKAAARQAGDPMSLGAAVTAMCRREKLAFEHVVSGVDGVAAAARLADRMERDQVATNAAVIVKARR